MSTYGVSVGVGPGDDNGLGDVLVRSELTLSFDLHPSTTGRTREGIEAELNAMVESRAAGESGRTPPGGRNGWAGGRRGG